MTPYTSLFSTNEITETQSFSVSLPENTQRIISYLSYLRDVSRKIISRTGFEKCFLTKDLGYALQFDDTNTVINKNNKYYTAIKQYAEFTENNYDKKLFLGFGTVIGTRKRVYAAPLISVQCELETDDKKSIMIEPDMGTLSLNYDLISSLFIVSGKIDTEDDIFNVFSDDENKTIDEIEEKLKSFVDFDFENLSKFAHEIYQISLLSALV